MPELTDEEKRILELMNQLEAAEQAHPAPPSDEPARPLSGRFTEPLFFDADGKPFPVEKPLPTAEEQSASNQTAIQALEERIRQAKAQPPADGPTRDRDDGDRRR
jgi:hypothetical protein